MLFGLGALVALVIGGVFILQNAAPEPAPVAAVPTLDPNAKQWTFGGAARCATNPTFVAQFGFDPQLAALSTSERTVRGLSLVEIGPNGDTSRKGKVFQHPSWRDGGYLGPISRDGRGNVYVGPVPVISTLYNPPNSQNDLYRVDAASGVLTRALTLPPMQPSDNTNPYGILGMALDCDTNSLYVSSVMGSTRKQELGRIYRVDLATNTVAATLDNVDAMGLGVFNGASGKRLYFGNTRNAEIRSVALDDSGAFRGEARAEISLDGLGPRGDDRARRITISPDNIMQVFGVEFGYNLIAPTEKQETQYRFRYDQSADKWQLITGP